MRKEIEIYNKWFQNESDYSQAMILNAIKEALAQSASSIEFGEWQCCPVCNGSGQDPNCSMATGVTICTVCNGNKIIVKPIIKN